MNHKIIGLVIILSSLSGLAPAREIHVSVKGNDQSEGSVILPLRTINAAAQRALPGDSIVVHAGTYREWINPLRGGDGPDNRIVYQACPGEKVEVKGSEIVKGWIREKDKNGVWKIILPNAFFGKYNPYKDSINGDWFNRMGRIHHAGEVFLNGKPFYEMENIDKVNNPKPVPQIKDQQGSVFTWYCESNDQTTTIWANFHQFNPNKEQVELSLRPTIFYPDRPGINYLTIRGFHFSQAATQWAAPTAEQIGMISTHWNKGWIIEGNVISESKCNGISLGKERGTGHNVWTRDEGNINRDGNIHYIEVVFNVLRNHWDKDHVGSHIVRGNTIYNCGQTAICGSMGGVFSTIEKNHIHHIYTNYLYSGAEMAGIKLHAPIDATIRQNRIHDCGRGIWLDWMTQGTRVSQNLLYRNDSEDLFVEVSHGPFTVDNNIMLSPHAVLSVSQGGAYVHNLFAGEVVERVDPNRFTPYFLPHSIEMAGLTTFYGGDDRYYNNLFVGFKGQKVGFDGYDRVKLPLRMSGNAFLSGSKKLTYDVSFFEDRDFDAGLKLVEESDAVFLEFSLPDSFYSHTLKLIDSPILGKAKISKGAYELPNGQPILFDVDYLGSLRSDPILSGPFGKLSRGKMRIRLW